MTTILSLSDEPKFTIKTVASQTGIHPETLRAWERRKKVLNPYRAENHYRLYSERDVAILCWLKYRVDEGMPISCAVSEFHDMTNNRIWPEALPRKPQSITKVPETTLNKYANQLGQALIKNDEIRAGDLLRELHDRFDLRLICTQVFEPVLCQINEAWYRGEITASARHISEAYLSSNLAPLLHVYSPKHHAPLIFVGCAPMEPNELSAIMLAVMLCIEGFQVEYLGPDISIEDLAEYSGYMLPAMVILSASSDFTAHEARRMQEMLAKVRSTAQFAYIGQAFELRPGLRAEIPGTYLGESVEIALQRASSLLKSRRKTLVPERRIVQSQAG